jgi:LacI family transcriptional regulator
MEERHIPYVFSHYPPASEDYHFDAVYPDHLWGGKLVGDHLASLGYKHIVCMCVEGGIQEFTLRVEGLSRALAAHGVSFSEENVLYCPFTIEDEYTVIKAHVEQIKHADALFAVTDLLAFGAMQAAKDLGLRIPEDLAIVGYDDIPLAKALSPPLTSVHQPREELARETCRRLMEKIERKDRSKTGISTVLRPHLVVRESCGASLREK